MRTISTKLLWEEYEDLEDDPSNREEFMTKRMNLPVTDLESDRWLVVKRFWQQTEHSQQS